MGSADGADMLARDFANMARFRTRSEGSDRYADRTKIMQVVKAIDAAVCASRSERDGLCRRVSDALSSAAVLAGNGTDEYIERDMVDTHRLREYDAEIANGQRRLDHLDDTIAQFERLKSELTARFSSVVSTRER
jgi:hypothetical protein